MIEVESYIGKQTSLLGKVRAHWPVRSNNDSVVGVFLYRQDALSKVAALNSLRGGSASVGDFLFIGQLYIKNPANVLTKKIHGVTDGCTHNPQKGI